MRALCALIVAGAAALSLSSCAAAPPDDPAPARPPFATTTPGPLTPSGAATPVPDARWSAILADLAERGVSDEPVVTASERVTWNDGSWGCPKPGVSYLQARTPGMRVIVEAGGASYDYRFGASDTPVLCTR